MWNMIHIRNWLVNCIANGLRGEWIGKEASDYFLLLYYYNYSYFGYQGWLYLMKIFLYI